MTVMRDELKKYTEQHRPSFESYKLDLDEAWSGIDSRLNELDGKSHNFPWMRIMKVAAIFLVIMTVAFGYYLNSQRLELDKNGIALHNISSELADTEAFYANQIAEKIKLIEVSVGNIDPQISTQLEILDEDYQSLKEDLRDDADSEEVINAMIEYYRLKLGMLEKILDEIQKNDTKDHEEALAV